MSFLQPLLLLGLLGAAVPIIIHLIHKRKPRTHQFAAIELVMRSVERVERKWRLRRLLLLAARVLILAALALAAAGPLLGQNAVKTAVRTGPERLAIVIDTSLSMRAVYDGRSAFARAKTLARNAVDDMGPEDQITVIAARGRATALVERPTADRPRLLEVLDALEPSFETTELAEAVSQAVQDLAPPAAKEGAAETKLPGFRVLVLTDLARGSLTSAADLAIAGTDAAARLELVDVLEGVPAETRTNRALTEFSARSVPGRAPRTLELRARAHGYQASSDRVQPLTMKLSHDDKELAESLMELPEGSSGDKRIIHAFDKEGPSNLTLNLESDRLAEDDTRYVVFDIKPPVRILIVDGDPSGLPKDDEVFYLERALHAGASDQPPPRLVTVDDFSRTDLNAFDVIVLAGVDAFARSDGARLVEWVEAGGGLWITASESIDVELYNSELKSILPRPFRGMKVVDGGAVGSGGAVTLSQPNEGHPVMTPFQGEAAGGLLTAKTLSYLLFQPGSKTKMTTWVSFDDGQPALVERAAGRGKVVVLATSIDRDLTDLPIRPAFLPLVRRTVLYLGGSLAPPDKRRTLVGQPREIRLPKGIEGLEIVGPDGTRTEFDKTQLAQEKLQFVKTELPGHYIVLASFAGPAEELRSENFAVNLDPRESDLRPVSLEEGQEILAQGGGGTSTKRTTLGALGKLSPRFLVGLLLLLMAFAYIIESSLTGIRIGR